MCEKKYYIPFFSVVGFYIGYLQLINKDILFYPVLIIGFLIVLIKKSDSIVIEKNFFTVGMLCWIIYMIISIFHTYSIISGIKYVLVISLFTIFAIILSGMKNWIMPFFELLIFFLGGHVLFTIFSVCFTETSLKISAYLLPAEAQNLTERWAREMHHYAGLSGQTAMNALFFSILLGLVTVCLFLTNNRFRQLLFFLIDLLLMILLFLTGKKASILVSFLGILIVFFYYQISVGIKKEWLQVYGIGAVLITVLITLGVLVISTRQFETFMGSSVVSRQKIYGELQGIFMQNFILGSGVDSISFFIGHSAHNNYIQLLCEYGIVGFCIMVVVQVGILVDVLQRGYVYIKYGILQRKEKIVILFFCYFQVYFLLTGFFESTLFTYRIFLVYVLSIAASYSILKKNGEKNEYIIV